MFGIIPVKYINIEVDVKTYNRVIRVITVGDGGTSDIEVNKFFVKRLKEKNEFVRLRCDNYYMDIELKKWRRLENGRIVIHFGKLLDCNRGSIIINKKKK